MNEFRAGAFRKSDVSRFVRGLCPIGATQSLSEIPPCLLVEIGKKLAILDVDNTIVPWRSEDIPPETHEWLAEANRCGLSVCLLSNTRNPERLNRLAKRLSIKAFHGKFKPNPIGYKNAMAAFGVKAHETIMIGDQLFTDILGANRAGVDSIWVHPMTKKDFVGTKVSRMGERMARRFLNKTHEHGGLNDWSSRLSTTEMAEIEATNLDGDEPKAIFGLEITKRPVVRQILKFCVVGGTSFIIDAGLHWILMFAVPVQNQPLGVYLGTRLLEMYPQAFAFATSPEAAATPVLKVVSASVAILNSFYWNRKWTFGIRGSEKRLHQLQKFVFISLLGMVLNTIIVTGLFNIIPGHPKRSWAVATMIATVIVAMWNFAGQKFFAFRSHEK